MWLFLVSELLLFSGLFTLYAAYRSMYADGFVEALRHNTIVYGTVNTYVLLTSSFTIALAVWAVRSGKNRLACVFVLASAALGVAFLGIKAAEYLVHIHEGALAGRITTTPRRRRWAVIASTRCIGSRPARMRCTSRVASAYSCGSPGISRKGATPPTITRRSRTPRCTGTSSTSCGSSSGRFTTWFEPMPNHQDHARRELKKYVLTYAALLVLATVSWLLAIVHVPGGVVFGILIGAVKAVLVLAFFMHLADEAFSFKLAIAVSTILVAIFIGLTVVDPATRTASSSIGSVLGLRSRVEFGVSRSRNVPSPLPGHTPARSHGLRRELDFCREAPEFTFSFRLYSPAPSAMFVKLIQRCERGRSRRSAGGRYRSRRSAAPRESYLERSVERHVASNVPARTTDPSCPAVRNLHGAIIRAMGRARARCEIAKPPTRDSGMEHVSLGSTAPIYWDRRAKARRACQALPAALTGTHAYT